MSDENGRRMLGPALFAAAPICFPKKQLISLCLSGENGRGIYGCRIAPGLMWLDGAWAGSFFSCSLWFLINTLFDGSRTNLIWSPAVLLGNEGRQHLVGAETVTSLPSIDDDVGVVPPPPCRNHVRASHGCISPWHWVSCGPEGTTPRPYVQGSALEFPVCPELKYASRRRQKLL